MSDNSESMALLESETNFGLSLLREQNLNESIVFSPLSIALCLAMVHAGAKGETKSEIRNTLCKGSTDEQFEQHFTKLTQGLIGAEKGTEVNFANRLFSRKGFEIKPQFLSTIQKSLSSGATELDFMDAQSAAAEINRFVNESTKGHIKEIIKSSAFTDDLVSILVNALYFKGIWKNKFKKANTVSDQFYTSEDHNRSIDFLKVFNAHRLFAENDDWEMIQLPYKDETFSLNVLLPKKRFGLREAVRGLGATALVSLLTNTKNTFLNIEMPKFRVERDLAVKEDLEKLGIQRVFTQSADLSNLADGIFVSKVSHKALIEVDEDGTTAAAATTMEIMTKSAMMMLEEPREFKADHPFLFVLTKDHHPLFIGVHN